MSRRGHSERLALVVALGLAACAPVGPDGDGGQADGGPLAAGVRVGTGIDRFEPLSAGDDVRFVAGFQGGYHVWGGLRVKDVDPRDLELELAVDIGGETVAEVGFLTDLWEAEDEPGAFELYGVTILLDYGRDPDALDGEEGLLRARVEDRDGVVREGAVRVTLQCCDGFGGGGGGVGDGNGLDGGPAPGGGRGEGEPLVHAVRADARAVAPGGAISVEVIASDPDGDALSVAWQSEAGSFAPADAAATTWTAPQAPGTYRLEVAVSDGQRSRSAAIDVEVTVGD